MIDLPNDGDAMGKPANRNKRAKKARGDGNGLGKAQLIDRIVAASGAQKADVKKVLDAALAELGQAIDRGQSLQLPPLGRVKVLPSKEGAEAGGIRLRLRRGGAGPGKETGGE